MQPSPTRLPVLGSGVGGPWDFDGALDRHGLGALRRGRLQTVQINVGRRCNQACHHCHVDAGPRRTEAMPRAVAERVVELVAQADNVQTVDITGGAPELNPNFRWLVSTLTGLGRQVIDRCNLTVLNEPGHEDLGAFLAQHKVAIVASLPCYGADNVDRQRGRGVFESSIDALQRLNELGYGQPGGELSLDLVYNPLGAFLPPAQGSLEKRYRDELQARHGLRFHRLFTLANMPIQRFARMLLREGKFHSYMSLLVNHFNPATVEHLMCRSLLSIGYDGRLFDCDFNQMLQIGSDTGDAHTVWDLEQLQGVEGRAVATASHCFGCTAGAGSSCGGALQ